MDKLLKYLMLMLVATVSLFFTSCSKSKIDAEREKQQEVLERWEEVSRNLDDITGINDNSNSDTLKKKAENSFNDALFYYDEALSLTNYLNSINADYAAMSYDEVSIYSQLKSIQYYFENITRCKQYMTDENYESVIHYAGLAIYNLNKSKEAYMKAGVLNKYR